VTRDERNSCMDIRKADGNELRNIKDEAAGNNKSRHPGSVLKLLYAWTECHMTASIGQSCFTTVLFPIEWIICYLQDNVLSRIQCCRD
jgi:hypothetical protein